MMQHLGQLISEYGYLIVAAFIFLEGIAIPFPTDTTLVIAAAYAANGRLSIVVIFFISTMAALLGTTVAFVGGRRGGDFFERHARKVSPAILSRTRGFFERHGGSAIVAGRFIPVARMLISPMAGLSTMTLARFTLFNAVGAAAWSAVFCGVGYFFGQHPPAFGHGLVRGAFVVALGMAVLATIVVAGGYLVEESDAAWRAEGTIWHRLLTSPPLRWLASHSPRARSFLFRRFTAGDYLGLNLTLGLGLSFVALVIFRSLTNALLTGDSLPQFDLQLAAALRETATPARDAFWGTISRLGSHRVMLIPSIIMGLVLAVRRSWLPLGGWVASLTGALVLETVVKNYLVHPASTVVAGAPALMAAPSAQALGAAVTYGMIAYFIVLLVGNRRAAPFIVTGAFLLVGAICFGRLYLGTRYFSDIVSGLSAGGVWLSASVTGLEVARRRTERERASVRPFSEDRR